MSAPHIEPDVRKVSLENLALDNPNVVLWDLFLGHRLIVYFNSRFLQQHNTDPYELFNNAHEALYNGSYPIAQQNIGGYETVEIGHEPNTDRVPLGAQRSATDTSDAKMQSIALLFAQKVFEIAQEKLAPATRATRENLPGGLDC